MAAGLYGPAAWSAAETGGVGSLCPDLPSCCSLAAATAARTPRPAEDPSAGLNEGSAGRLAGSGTVPRPAPEPPTEREGAVTGRVTSGQGCPGDARASPS